MPRFYFHVSDKDDRLVDEEGMELSGEPAAIAMALVLVRDLMSYDILEGRLCLHCIMDVTDEQNEAVHAQSFFDAVAIHGHFVPAAPRH